MNLITQLKMPIPMAQYLGSHEDVVPIVVRGNSMLPVFRHGDCLLVDPSGSLKIGDRVVARDIGGAIVGGTLLYRNEERIEIAAYSTSKRDSVLKAEEISFLGRVMWASQ